MGNITFSQNVIDLTKYMLKHSSALTPSFQCSFMHLCRVCAHLFHGLLRETAEKANYFFHLHLPWRLNCSENFYTFLFHRHIAEFETDRSWQILLITIKLKTFVAPTQPVHSPMCLNRLWRSASPYSLGLQSWWRARRNHIIQLMFLAQIGKDMLFRTTWTTWWVLKFSNETQAIGTNNEYHCKKMPID